VYFLGDYVDRGPDSKGVLDIIMSMTNAVCHKGNHEDMMLKAILTHAGNKEYFDHWMRNGGETTLISFNSGIAEKYIHFLSNLKLITELPNFYLCHAGIWEDAMRTPEEVLLWDRGCEVDIDATNGRDLICGHTPTPYNEMSYGIARHKIIIDGGCVYSGRPRLGNLVALRLDDMKIISQRNIDI
jgi:serine/threonine protein phosphatase 1